ncbi:hypothetical protein [Neoroseomonas oryzicola]|uniref:Uncharacterized protein n=1 Tax=Neoroseomonas oryzicola TaxID=535904 RepID=A0A9X9WJG2_9PROT|nr:hypothetical protein [Neoroseomonas oryzicola]MBR0660472.1 hypothetical protein [Neoroseomonas oryzicola]NKE18240.1 hypothetical protein [Neoroseomonas oryzicola]
MTSTPDYDLLAVTYLGAQQAGPRLRDLAFLVAKYRSTNETPGRRSARKADLNAVAGAAGRLQAALGKIDLRSQVEALQLGVERRDELARDAASLASQASKAPAEVSQHQYQTRLTELHRLENLLATVTLGFGALADQQAVATGGGRPERHDALVMGLEWLLGLWKQYRSDAPTMSENAKGFGAFALEMLANDAVGFSAGTVRGGVVEILKSTGSR